MNPGGLGDVRRCSFADARELPVERGRVDSQLLRSKRLVIANALENMTNVGHLQFFESERSRKLKLDASTVTKDAARNRLLDGCPYAVLQRLPFEPQVDRGNPEKPGPSTLRAGSSPACAIATTLSLDRWSHSDTA